MAKDGGKGGSSPKQPGSGGGGNERPQSYGTGYVKKGEQPSGSYRTSKVQEGDSGK
jgi:hypothetical protein